MIAKFNFVLIVNREKQSETREASGPLLTNYTNSEPDDFIHHHWFQEFRKTNSIKLSFISVPAFAVKGCIFYSGAAGRVA